MAPHNSTGYDKGDAQMNIVYHECDDKPREDVLLEHDGVWFEYSKICGHEESIVREVRACRYCGE